MAFSTLTFTKSWENAADFPTYEENEQQVRADLQYLHDEMRDAFNALVARLNDAAVAGDLPIAPVEGLSAATVQEAIEEIQGNGVANIAKSRWIGEFPVLSDASRIVVVTL